MEDNIQTNSSFWRNKKFDWFDWFIVIVIFGLFLAIATYKSTRVSAQASTYTDLYCFTGVSFHSEGGYVMYQTWIVEPNDYDGTSFNGVMTLYENGIVVETKEISSTGNHQYRYYDYTYGAQYYVECSLYSASGTLFYNSSDSCYAVSTTPTPTPDLSGVSSAFSVSYNATEYKMYIYSTNTSGSFCFYVNDNAKYSNTWDYSSTGTSWDIGAYLDKDDDGYFIYNKVYTFTVEYSYVRGDNGSLVSDSFTLNTNPSDDYLNIYTQDGDDIVSTYFTYDVTITANSNDTWTVVFNNFSGTNGYTFSQLMSIQVGSSEGTYTTYGTVSDNSCSFTITSSFQRYFYISCKMSNNTRPSQTYTATYPTYIQPAVATPTPTPQITDNPSSGSTSSSSYNPITNNVVSDTTGYYSDFMTEYFADYTSFPIPADEYGLNYYIDTYGLPGDYDNLNCYYVVYHPLESTRIFLTLYPISNDISSTYVRPYLICDTVGSYKQTSLIFGVKYNPINSPTSSDAYGTYHTMLTDYNYVFDFETSSWTTCSKPVISTHVYEDVVHVSNVSLYGLDYCGMYNGLPYCNYTGTYGSNAYLIQMSNDVLDYSSRDTINWTDYLNRFNYSDVVSFGDDYIIYKIAFNKPYFMICLDNGIFGNYHRSTNTFDFVAIDSSSSVTARCYFLTEYNYKVQLATTLTFTTSDTKSIDLYPSAWNYSLHNLYNISLPVANDDTLNAKPVFLYLSKLTVDYDSGKYAYVSTKNLPAFYNCGDISSLIGAGTDSYSLTFAADNSTLFNYLYNLFSDLKFRVNNLSSSTPVISFCVPSTSTSTILNGITSFNAINFSWYTGTLRNTFYLAFSCLIYWRVLLYVIKSLKNVIHILGGGDHE